MAQAKARPKEKAEEEVVTPPEVAGLTPLERMTELTRRIIAVPKSEIVAMAKKKKGHR